jgi:hypothetical protein
MLKFKLMNLKKLRKMLVPKMIGVFLVWVLVFGGTGL